MWYRFRGTFRLARTENRQPLQAGSRRVLALNLTITQLSRSRRQQPGKEVLCRGEQSAFIERGPRSISADVTHINVK